MLDINQLTIAQAKEIASLFTSLTTAKPETLAAAANDGLCGMIGKKVIIRTCSAGVWFGELSQKSGNEVILSNARRMWKWKANESISLSAVSIYGVCHKESKIVEAVPAVWLEAIEIIPCCDNAILSLEGAPNVKAD